MRIYCGHPVLDTSEGMPVYVAPGGPGYTYNDFMTPAQRALRTPVATGGGFFVFDRARTATGLEVDLGADPTASLSALQISGIEITLGLLPGTIQSSRLDLILQELSSDLADPTGVDFTKPLMPTANLTYEYRLGPFLIVSERFNLGSHRARLKVLARIHESYKQLVAAIDGGRITTLFAQKVVGGWMRKYRENDHTVFVANGFRDIGFATPETSDEDLFNRADENLEVSADWSMIGLGSTNTGTSSWEVSGNEARPDQTGNDSEWALFGTSMSTDDFWAEVKITQLDAPTSTRNWAGAFVRYQANTSGKDCYYAQGTITNASVENVRLSKIVDGTGANLADVAQSINLGDVVRTEASGSTIRSLLNGSQITSLTDPDIDTLFENGMASRLVNTVSDVQVDDYKVADLVAGFAYSQGVIIA